MNPEQHQRFKLPDASYASGVKRDISRLAAKASFSETELGKINLVVSEMASNLVRHTTEGGEFLVRHLQDQDRKGLEIICLDRGPGMAEPQRMLQDGVSTYGSAGEGLGAIKRQSDFFDLYSHPDSGTIMLARIFETLPIEGKKLRTSRIELGAILVAKRTGDLSGDGWNLQESADQVLILAVDGLGHGALAHDASQKAINSFRHSRAGSVKDKLQEIHAALKPTRGAVGAIAAIGKGNLRFCGIGNITARIFGFNSGGTLEVTKNLMSYNGTLGHNIPNQFQEQTADWETGNLLVMHSDGLKTTANLEHYPKLHQHDAGLIAAILFRDFSRGTDDALVVVAKLKS